MTRKSQKDDMSQIDKFKKAAKDLEADENVKHWEEKLKKVVGNPPKQAHSD